MADLIRWTPGEFFSPILGDVSDAEREMNRMLRRAFGRKALRDRVLEEGAAWYPAVDVEEEPDKYLVKAELPGMKQEDIKVSVRDGTLILTGEKKTEHEEKHEGYHRYERSYGKFQRAFTLPTQVKSEKIKATYKNGILEIDIPKSEEAKPKEIEVKVS